MRNFIFIISVDVKLRLWNTFLAAFLKIHHASHYHFFNAPNEMQETSPALGDLSTSVVKAKAITDTYIDSS
jgi:hypothetical protein